ncbi:histidine kinase [Gracilibacillus caseinilyticus]|uniref:histidine kinase n=1 Tax=Gracilibacillus caseinilyticus TaxID=2932256 RepID=A0ABY4ESM0_9BACI|nr:histidine kinase [Gracilibacillus caseinilyticus]UOQ46649.1 histidine kinase [Gracilibacillus caseinilyticus]
MKSPFSFENISLKNRISLVFAVSTFLLLMCTIIISYQSMSNILTNKLHDSFSSNLRQIRLSIEDTIDDLNYVAQQIAFSENIGYKLENYLRYPPSYDRVKVYEDIKNEINVITFSNPGIGLSLLYNKQQDHYLFYNYGVKPDFSLSHDPLLAEGYNMHTYGPHISMEKYKDNHVLSTSRKLDVNFSDQIYIYLESNLDFTNDLLEIGSVMNNANYMMLDENQNIIYSENDSFPRNSTFPSNSKGYGKQNGFYWFEESTKKGWSIVALIPIAEYNQEMNQWAILMLYIAILFVLISLLVSWLLWKTLYKPMNQFRHEIKLMGDNNFHSEVVNTKIPEFVDLIDHFRDMRGQIVELIHEIEKKERMRADLEVEKLKHQINPHFLMNTLDTAKWLAISGDKQELTSLLTSLNKLLHYNMGKLGILSTLEDELESMQQYLVLQQIRYDFEFETFLFVKEEVLQAPLPRFILQPIVENALYHGLVDEGTILITVKMEALQLVIDIADNGKGMTSQQVEELLHKQTFKQTNQGMGIGLNYVKRVLARTYGLDAKIEIVSHIGKGTVVTLRIPYLKGEKA